MAIIKRSQRFNFWRVPQHMTRYVWNGRPGRQFDVADNNDIDHQIELHGKIRGSRVG